MPSRRSRPAALVTLVTFAAAALPALLCPHPAGAAVPGTALTATAALPGTAARGPLRDPGGPGWTARPAAGPATDGAEVRPYFYLEGVPGTVLEDRLALDNPTGETRTLTLRGADAYNAEGGALAVRPARETRAAGSWVSFGAAPATVRIPPHTRAVVPFTVTVPDGAAPGDHPAAVVAAEGTREAAVRVRLRVTGPALSALTVEDVAVTGEGAAGRITYALVNRGNTAVVPELVVAAEGLFGDLPDVRAHSLGLELLPGQRAELTESWPGAPVFGPADVTLTVTAAGGARAEGSASAWFVPWGALGWTGAGVLVLAGTAAAAALLVRTTRSRRAEAPRDGVRAGRPVPEAELTGAVR
ncbi:hypothetical protein [Streptomyces sp. NPDC086023]|uniref:hypothetical protein n=1 Tax=Streptomyces sp. NPDC086023 TaxID=3365746 RepID=UPI0037CCF65C